MGLGDTLSNTGGIAGLVKDKPDESIEDLIQADQGSQQPGVLKGLGQLLGADQPSAAAPAEPASLQTEGPGKKKGKKKQAAVVAPAQPVAVAPAKPASSAPTQPAPRQLMQNLFSSF
jgi:hypothetical protein